jgi:acyl-CoA hydrolase
MSDPGKTPAESRGELAELMMPQHANILGKVFGGTLLAMVDKAAAVAAIRHAGRTCVTAQIDRVSFHSPIEIGELVRCLSQVNWAGRSSMEVGVKVLATSLRTGDTRHTNTCYVTMVAVDDQGRPVPVPPLRPASDEDRRRFDRGRRRMEERKETRRREQEEDAARAARPQT